MVGDVTKGSGHLNGSVCLLRGDEMYSVAVTGGVLTAAIALRALCEPPVQWSGGGEGNGLRGSAVVLAVRLTGRSKVGVREGRLTSETNCTPRQSSYAVTSDTYSKRTVCISYLLVMEMIEMLLYLACSLGTLYITEKGK